MPLFMIRIILIVIINNYQACDAFLDLKNLTAGIAGALTLDNIKAFESNSFNYLTSELSRLDKLRMKNVISTIKEQNISIVGFYHTSAWKKYWREVILDQLKIIGISTRDQRHGEVDSHLLVSLIDALHLTVTGNRSTLRDVTSLIGHARSKVITHLSKFIRRDAYRNANESEKLTIREKAIRENLEEGEYGTITRLHRYCKRKVAKKQRAFVFYIHNKGASSDVGTVNPISDWREHLNDHIIRYPSTCIRALLNGYPTCGIELMNGRGCDLPEGFEFYPPHYSGNFWWADCAHIAALPGLWDPINNAWAAEFFLFNVSKKGYDTDAFQSFCSYNIFSCSNCGGEMYGLWDNGWKAKMCRSYVYKRLLAEVIVSDELVQPKVVQYTRLNSYGDVTWTGKNCHKLSKKPYMEQGDLYHQIMTSV